MAVLVVLEVVVVVVVVVVMVLAVVVILVLVVVMVMVVVVVVVVLGNWCWRSGGDSLCKGGSCNSCMSAIVKVGWCWGLLWG